MRHLIVVLVAVFTGLCWSIDGISIAAADRQAGDGVDIMIVNDAHGPVFFFVCGKYGATSRINLPNEGDYTVVHFQDAVNERALVAFDGDGRKVIECMKFVPGPFSILIQNNHVEKSAAKTEKAKKELHGALIEANLGKAKNAVLKKVPYGTGVVGNKLKLTDTNDGRVCFYGFFTISELPNGAFVCIDREGKAIYGQTNGDEELLQQVKLTGGRNVSLDERRGWLYKEERGETPRLWFFSYPNSNGISVQTYSDDNGVHWYPSWFLLRAVRVGEFKKGSSSTK